MAEMTSKRKIYGDWYNLPEELRNRLLAHSNQFYRIKDHGAWAVGNAGRYEMEAIAVLRTGSTLTWDVMMPALADIRASGLLVAVFAPGMRIMDIVFYSK